VRNAYGQFAALLKLLNNLVVFRVILKSTAGVAARRQAEAIQIPQKMAGRIVLILQRQLWAERESLVQNPCVRIGEQQACGLPGLVALDDSAGRLGSLLGVTDSSQ